LIINKSNLLHLVGSTFIYLVLSCRVRLSAWNNLASTGRIFIQFGVCVKGNVHAHNRPQGPKGVPGRLRPRIFLTFGTTRVVRRLHPQGNSLVLIFRGLVDPRAHGSVGSFGKNPQCDRPGIDPETFRLVVQCLNQYATPGPLAFV
jgi:hypothetical protein